MKSAYRIPTGLFPVIDRFVTQETPANTPISEMVVNSVITAPPDRESRKAGRPIVIRGFAWDGGYGITRIELSVDGSANCRGAGLGNDLGGYALPCVAVPMDNASEPHSFAASRERKQRRVGELDAAALARIGRA